MTYTHRQGITWSGFAEDEKDNTALESTISGASVSFGEALTPRRSKSSTITEDEHG